MTVSLADAQAAVASAQATLAAATAAVVRVQAAVTAAHANVTQKQAALNVANQNALRARTPSQRRAAQQAIARAQAELTAAQQALSAAQAEVPKVQALLIIAKASLDRANANLVTAAAAQAISAAPKFSGLKRALLIGINYKGTAYELYGCINDAKNMQIQLQTYYPMCKEYRLITDETDEKPTRANILAAIDWLVAGLRPGENVMFHYSGHGGRVRDTNGDEVTGLDSCIYPVNGGRMETIIDDELRAALAMRIPAGSKCLVVLDSCHSGTAVDLRCAWQAPAAGALTYKEDTKYAKTAGDVLFLSGCRDTQYAADTVGKDDRPCGALTMALLETWKAYGAGIKLKYLLWDVRKFLREYGYEQVPELTTGAFMDMNGVFDLGKGV